MREIVKVREDFELEGLEKYGFYPNNAKNAYWFDLKCDVHFYEELEYKYDSWLAVYVRDRELRIVDHIDCNKGMSRCFDIMKLGVFFDLVKDGVVVKEVVE